MSTKNISYNSYSSFFNEKTGSATDFIQSLIQQLEGGQDLTSYQIIQLNNVRQKDLAKNNIGWDLFYALLKNQKEIESGYWTVSQIATKLMSPKIIQLKKKCENIRYSQDDDFDMAILMEIQRVFTDEKIKNKYDPSKSQFAVYITPFMQQIAYTYETDMTEYTRKQFELFVDSYDRRVEAGESIEKDTNYLDAETKLIKDTELSNFENKCKIANIGYEKGSFTHEDGLTITNARDYVIMQKFLGGIVNFPELLNSSYIKSLTEKDKDENKKYHKEKKEKKTKKEKKETVVETTDLVEELGDENER